MSDRSTKVIMSSLSVVTCWQVSVPSKIPTQTSNNWLCRETIHPLCPHRKMEKNILRELLACRGCGLVSASV